MGELAEIVLMNPPTQPRTIKHCQAHERDSLERLCRYIARPALSNERLSVNDRGQVVYRLKHPFHDGTTHVVLDPMDFIARLAGPEVPLAQRVRSVPTPPRPSHPIPQALRRGARPTQRNNTHITWKRVATQGRRSPSEA